MARAVRITSILTVLRPAWYLGSLVLGGIGPVGQLLKVPAHQYRAHCYNMNQMKQVGWALGFLALWIGLIAGFGLLGVLQTTDRSLAVAIEGMIALVVVAGLAFWKMPQSRATILFQLAFAILGTFMLRGFMTLINAPVDWIACFCMMLGMAYVVPTMLVAIGERRNWRKG